MPEPATRAGLRLDRAPLHSLADPKPESLRSVMLALAEAPAAVVQLAISPDVSWQKRALHELDQLAGLEPERGLVVSLLGWVVDGLFHLVLPEQPDPPRPARRPSRPAAPAAKAWSPGYRSHLRPTVSPS